MVSASVKRLLEEHNAGFERARKNCDTKSSEEQKSFRDDALTAPIRTEAEVDETRES